MAKQIIKIAAASDEASIIALMVLAFSADPAARWTWPDPQQFLRYFPNFVKALGGKAFAHGSAYYVEGYAGSAMWLPPEVSPDENVLVDLVQHTGYAPVQKDVFSVFEQMARYHPQEPHWFLPFIGVDPLIQGKGYGAALMQHALVQCDRDRALSYLESSNPKNVPLYERFGFELLGRIQVGTSPPIFPMLRKPL
jgi:GNAT superfamily N-acetyltransferase